MSRIKRAYAVLGLIGLLVVAGALPALAAEHNAALQTALEGAADDVTANIMAILPTIVGVAALLLVITVAWRFFRRFVR